ncbi:unnamed protein product, partial [Ectocarpus sp. 12 AP-2014]
INLRQCNLDRLEEEAFAVSDLDSPRYGQYLSAREVCEVTSCPDREEGIQGVLEWLLGAVFCSHVVVSMSAAKAAETFPEAAFRSHRRERGGKRGGTGAVLRATGDVLLPEALAVHVEFVSGLTEL